MISPGKARQRALNAQRASNELEAYIDKILTICVAAGEEDVTVVLQGYEYVLAKYTIMPIITLYSRDWIVEDITGKRAHMYILKFTPRVSDVS